jgi:hypothetical protein
VEDSAAAPSKTAPNIVLHIPLDGQSNKVINFARLAEEQYGFAALHPRLAAQRERLARVAAASAALEKHEKNGRDSAAEDDLSVDVDRDSDADGDVVMSGMGSTNLGPNGASSDTGTGQGAGGEGKKKMRKKKIEEYDRDDPFVDDSELAWEEHAVASKDGFFVYSGPLIPEGEKVAVERYSLHKPQTQSFISHTFLVLARFSYLLSFFSAYRPHKYDRYLKPKTRNAKLTSLFTNRADGTIKRGRGRGRGSSAHHHSSHAASGGTTTSSRGRGGGSAGSSHGHHHNGPGSSGTGHDGPGSGRGAGTSRGSTTTRKPRMTKADRALMEKEKLEREKMAMGLAGKGGGGRGGGGGQPAGST